MNANRCKIVSQLNDAQFRNRVFSKQRKYHCVTIIPLKPYCIFTVKTSAFNFHFLSRNVFVLTYIKHFRDVIVHKVRITLSPDT
jgi:hypothetical protein